MLWVGMLGEGFGEVEALLVGGEVLLLLIDGLSQVFELVK